MSDGKTASLWGCERIHGPPDGPEEPPGSNTVTHIFTGVLVPSFTIPVRVQPRTDNAVLGIGQVLPARPHLTIPVANTETFPGGSVDSNNEVDFITYCEVLQTKAETLAEDLQTLYNEKIAAAIGSAGAGAGGGGVSEGVGNSCEEDFEIKANTFVVNCNALVVDQCGTPPPVTFTTGNFNIIADGYDVTVTNGTVTLTISGSTVNVTGGSLQVAGSDVLTQAVADQRYASNTHVHTYQVTQVSQDANGDVSTSSSSANTSGPA
jgi:hypothetical protein